MHIHNYVTRDLRLAEHLRDGYVREQRHPTEPLIILNYTNKAQYENVWDDVTTKTRGLIFDSATYDVVARPFEKFFNWGQVERDMLPHGPIRVQDKMDGSLGILYREPSTGRLAIASRGSFTSDQAVHATDVLRTRYEDFQPLAGLTYLFEIIYPENRIVVDYGDTDDLVLLDMIDTETGESFITSGYALESWPGPVTERFEFDSIEAVLSAPPREGKEGFVITYGNGFRVKVKQEEYVRLHRLLTGVSSKSIWEILANGGDFTELLDRVPDEYYDWVKRVIADLRFEYNLIARMTLADFKFMYYGLPFEKGSPEHRKAFAKGIANHDFRGILFMHYDNKPVDAAIWKLVKPAYAKPYWNTTEDAA